MTSSTTPRGWIEFLVPASQGGEHLVTLGFSGTEELKEVLAYAQAHNFKPRFFGPSVANGSLSPTSTNGSAVSPPICPAHQKPMKPSTQESGGWFCPRRTKGEFCKYRSPDGVKISQVA